MIGRFALQHVILVPGIMGSELFTPQGEKVWPPTVLEMQTSYGRIDELLRDDLRVGDIIRKVWCVGVYRPLIQTLNDIGYAEGGGGQTLTVFAYDWRLDLERLADRLAAKVATLAAGGAEVAIVAHSMGGLIARLMLERPKFRTAPWFAQVRLLVTLGTPHLGAPLALARIMGMEKTLGVSGADFRRFAADRRYPSGYQLLPPRTEAPCWDVAAGGDLAALDIHDPAVAQRLRLDMQQLARARWVQDELAAGQRPGHVRYFQFAGTGHTTATRVNIGAVSASFTASADAGDGTVPLWSAAPLAGQKQVVPGGHNDFFGHDAFKAVFYRLFGASFPVPPLGAAPVMTLSVPELVLRADRPIEVALYPSVAVTEIRGRLTLARTGDPDTPWTEFRPPVPLVYEGPEIGRLVVSLPPVEQPGFYRIGFDGAPAASAPVIFAASQPGSGGGE